MKYLLTLLAVYVLTISAARAQIDRTTQPSTQPMRAAHSIHLRYPSTQCVAFYNEVKVERSTSGSYYMVCGWSHGYFGIQDHENNRHNMIFSVWDPGKADRPEDVPEDQRVKLIYKADDVQANRFGGEGTGGHSGFAFDWKLGETYQFLVTAKVDGAKSDYAGWFFMPDTKTWKHLVTFETITKKGDLLHGLYSFVEDFRRDGASADEVRRADYLHAWAMDPDGKWMPLTKVQFTGAGKNWEPNPAVDAGTVPGGFYLQNGGDTKETTERNATIERAVEKDERAPEIPKEVLEKFAE